MADHHLESVSSHASQRLAQRNLSYRDIEYVLSHGRRIRNGKALFIYLGRRDIPAIRSPGKPRDPAWKARSWSSIPNPVAT